jgi:hypothetical protein
LAASTIMQDVGGDTDRHRRITRTTLPDRFFLCQRWALFYY